MAANPFLFLAPLNGSLAFNDRFGGGTLTGSGAVRWKAAEGARTNLIKNPRAANNTTGWTAFGSPTMTRVTTSSIGPTAVRIASSVLNEGGSPYGTSGIFQMRNKVAHTFAFDASTVSGATDWKVDWYELRVNNSNVLSFQGSENFTAPASPTRFAFTYTPTGTGAHIVFGFIRRASSVSGTIDVSNCTLEEGTLTASQASYFDGSTGAWLDPITGQLGTAHASPSVSRATAWVEEGTTNTVPDPSFEAATITTSWVSQGSAAISKVATHAYSGSNGGKVACTASTGDGISQIVATAPAALTGQTWTVQARVRAFASGDVGKTVTLRIQERDSGGLLVKNNLSGTFALTDAWQLISYTVALSGGVSTASALAAVMNGSATACDLVVDAVKLEQKAYATSYCDGSLGTGYAWNGTAHASSSTRTATTITTTAASRLSSLMGSIFARDLREYSTGSNQYIFAAGSYGTAGQDWIAAAALSATGLYRTGTASIKLVNDGLTAPGSWETNYHEWADTVIRASRDNTASTTGTRDAPTGAMTGTLRIGESFGDPLGGLIGPVAIFSRPLTTKERAILAARTSWGWSMLKRRNRHIKVV